MPRPAALSEGSTVAVVSPAGPVVPDILEEGLEQLRDWGLEVRLDEDLYTREPDRGYLAGNDDVRRRAVQRALDDPEVEAIVFSRGGYGTMRILPDLEFATSDGGPTLLVGFSDLTAMHLYVAGARGIPTLHAPVVKSLRMHEPGDRSLASLRGALFGTRAAPIAVDGLDRVTGGEATGRLLGGNLTLLVHMIGSPLCPDLNDTILLLEDIGEEDYRLDRAFTALRLAEKSRRPAGLILGNFTDCDGTFVEESELAQFVEVLGAEWEVPAVADFPSGHGSRNLAVPMGVEAELDADSGRVRITEDAVGSSR
jgi:muramoyltetrapeptide carboxypeptidase